MKDIPSGYAMYWISDYLELIAPDGTVVGRYDPDISGEQIIEEALTHKAIHTVCQWDPGCPVCEDRRRRASASHEHQQTRQSPRKSRDTEQAPAHDQALRRREPIVGSRCAIRGAGKAARGNPR